MFKTFSLLNLILVFKDFVLKTRVNIFNTFYIATISRNKKLNPDSALNFVVKKNKIKFSHKTLEKENYLLMKEI
ncbi:hypothetical protein BWK59_12530, partial [Flavobacterium davisii]